MTTYAWPSDLGIESMDWGLDKATVGLENTMSKAIQRVDLLGWMWVVQATMPPRTMTSAGKLEAFMNTLVGGVDRVTMYRRDRPAPLGTLRGSPTLASSVAQFSDTLVLTNTQTRNRLRNSSFEVDSNSDGLADGWSVYNNGAIAVTASRVAGRVSGSAQRVNFTGTANTSTQGISTIGGTSNNPNWVATKAYVISFYAKATSGSGNLGRGFFVNFAATSPSTNAAILNPPLATDWQRYAFRIVWGGSVDANGAFYLSTTNALPARNGDIIFDDLQVEEGSDLTEREVPATILAGDMLGVSPQLFQVREDAMANDLGQMTVKLVNRTRTSLASGLPVVWDRPTATFVMEDDRSAFTFARMHMDRSTYRFREVPQ